MRGLAPDSLAFVETIGFDGRGEQGRSADRRALKQIHPERTPSSHDKTGTPDCAPSSHFSARPLNVPQAHSPMQAQLGAPAQAGGIGAHQAPPPPATPPSSIAQTLPLGHGVPGQPAPAPRAQIGASAPPSPGQTPAPRVATGAHPSGYDVPAITSAPSQPQ